MLKRRTSKFTATVAMVAAMLTAGGAANAVGTAPASPTATASVNAPSADASTTATGDYYYVCQYPNGTSLTITDGSIGSCQGASYVQEYLDGRLLQSLNVTAAGTPATASILSSPSPRRSRLPSTASVQVPSPLYASPPRTPPT